jgi:molybdate transport system regulatory protein
LLETIHRSGSISAAGRAMEMSYKRAWDLVDEINRICRQAAVERQDRRQERRRRGADAVRPSLVARYRKIERTATSRCAQGIAGVAIRYRPGEETRGLITSGKVCDNGTR